jgi:hypothetical protein
MPLPKSNFSIDNSRPVDWNEAIQEGFSLLRTIITLYLRRVQVIDTGLSAQLALNDLDLFYDKWLKNKNPTSNTLFQWIKQRFLGGQVNQPKPEYPKELKLIYDVIVKLTADFEIILQASNQKQTKIVFELTEQMAQYFESTYLVYCESLEPKQQAKLPTHIQAQLSSFNHHVSKDKKRD